MDSRAKGMNEFRSLLGDSEDTHREDISGKSALDARVKTRFTLRDKPDPRTSLVGVRNQAAVDGRTTHLGLLCAFPTVWMAQDQLERVFDGLPQGFAVCVGVDDEAARADEQIV